MSSLLTRMVTGPVGSSTQGAVLAATNPIVSLRGDEAIQLASDAVYQFADGTEMRVPPQSRDKSVAAIFADPTGSSSSGDSVSADTFRDGLAGRAELRRQHGSTLDREEIEMRMASLGAESSVVESVMAFKVAQEYFLTEGAYLYTRGEPQAEALLKAGVHFLAHEYELLTDALKRDAVSPADKAIFYPRTVDLLIQSANTYLLLGDKMKAATFFERAADDLNRGPNPANVGLASDGNTYNGTRAAGLRHAALKLYEDVYQQNMDDGMDALSQMVDVLKAMGRDVAAARLSALANPTESGLTLARKQLREAGDFLGAALVSDKLISLDPDADDHIIVDRVDMRERFGELFNPYEDVRSYINALAEAMTSLAFHERYVDGRGLRPGADQFIVDLVHIGMATEPKLDFTIGLPVKLKI